MGRKEVTKVLTDAASNYFINKMFSVFHEFGVGKRGQRRLDLLCLHTSLSVVGVEVKSCKVDYTTDKKWMEYLAYTNKLYLCLPPKLIESPFYAQILEDTKPHGIGIMSLTPCGRLYVIKSAKSRDLDDLVVGKMLMKMAWRGGQSLRNTARNRRQRFVLEE